MHPSWIPPLDPDFQPVFHQDEYSNASSMPIRFALERNHGRVSTHSMRLPISKGGANETDLRRVERLVKFLLWQMGGWKLSVDAPEDIVHHLASHYSHGGARTFDVELMERVYEKPFQIVRCCDDSFPKDRMDAMPLGGHLDGCRIGFDLGASDYKLAALENGEVKFSTEIPWDPKAESDPDFHIQKIQEGLELAASHLPRVDAIGGSSAGIYIENKVMVASLFRAVPDDLFQKKIKPLFLDLQKKWGVPLEVANDGDVTALAGAMSLKAKNVLGIAMGSSEAAGYLDSHGHILGWLNELAFAPVDLRPKGPTDDWSKDHGIGSQYFSQQAVVRLAKVAGIDLPHAHPAEQLVHVQKQHQSGDPRAEKIFVTIGVYLGHALAQYWHHYHFEHVLILGRVTSGRGGDLILQHAERILKEAHPNLEGRFRVHLPDEKSKRVGQAVAAASIPLISK